MGIPDLGADGEPKNQTVMERYYERQSNAGTNGIAADNSASPLDLFGSQSPQFETIDPTPAKSGQHNETVIEQFLNGPPVPNNAAANQNSDLGWPKMFNTAAQAAGPTPEQKAEDAEFQKLLEPHSSSSAPSTTKMPDSDFFSSLQKSSDSVFGQSIINPIAGPLTSLTTLSSDVSQPPGLVGLPGLTGQNSQPAAAAVPDWQPQPPPWMSSTPQLGVIPKPKF